MGRTTLRRATVLLALLALGLAFSGSAGASTLPSGFSESTVWTGLTNPTAVRFSADGRAFVAEKSGRIYVFDSVADPTPTLFADLSTNVYNFWDRGLLGLALDPAFPARPYVYVLYTYDAAIGGIAPRWGTPGVLSDPCPTPPGPTGSGCIASGRLSKLTASGSVMTGAEQVLIEDWCQQFPSHSVGTLAFGADGALYVTGGDGASFTFADYGQAGSPLNPCGDPPAGVGGTQAPPAAEGGALRSQDLRTSGDPVGLNGTVLRLNPDTGEGMPDNPLAFEPDANSRRIIAQGLRNPFRFAIRPGTSEVWLGDVGWNTFEELNRIAAPADAVVDNFGWPCYEGNGRQAGYDGPNLNICENLYAAGAGAITAPYFAYDHAAKVVAGETCPTGSSSVAGVAFRTTGSYPSSYDGALFFADYSRKCIWVLPRGANGLPDPAARATFVADAAGPVDLQTGPGGDLFYADFDGGTVRRISFAAGPGPEDKALGRAATASSVEKVGVEPPKANDGDSTTRWSSAYADNEWWQVDLGSARNVDSVQLNWEFAYASQYQILTSLNGTTFTAAATQTLAAPAVQTTSFSARSARYVRVLCLTRATTYGCSFWDARVFGSSDNAPGDTTPPTVAISAPNAGATVSASIDVNATANDNVAVAGVQFKLDGANLGPEDTSPPYTTPWNTTTTSNGNHTLTATARDTTGNTTTSTPVSVNVANSGPEDKALGRAATASSVEKVGVEPPKANDGDSTTRWSSAYADNEWWQVDLGSARNVDSVQLNWEFAYASQYQILTSLNGTTFTAAATQTLAAPAVQTTSFSARSARYVRVLCLTRATTYGCSFWDARVFGSSDNAPGDTTPPTVAISAPNAGATVSASIDVNATANDNVAVAGVQFKLDGANLGPEDTSPPYTTPWNTTTTSNGNHTLTATARDTTGNTTTSSGVAVNVQNVTPPANTPPQATVQAPPSTLTWAVGDTISFSATATDSEDGPLPPSAFSWSLTLQHCPSNCHSHAVQTFSGVSSGSFAAPDHDYPSHLELRLTATDSGGLTDVETIPLQPRTSTLTFTSSPSGLQLVVGPQSQATPFNRTVIVGSNNSIAAPSPQTLGTTSYGFSSWSDGGAATHNIVAPAAGATYLALFQALGSPSLVAAYGFNETSGSTATDASTFTNRGTISGATRITDGRFGRALSFDGVNDSVTVPDAPSLDLSSAMTIEGWVFLTSPLGSNGRPLIHKENTDGHSVYDLYANSGFLRPSTDVLVSPRAQAIGTAQLPLNAWTHLAATYDGATLKLYVGGQLVGTRAASGSIVQSAGALRLGSANMLRSWFRGRIDEVRIYNRALTAQEIGTDMQTPISP